MSIDAILLELFNNLCIHKNHWMDFVPHCIYPMGISLFPIHSVSCINSSSSLKSPPASGLHLSLSYSKIDWPLGVYVIWPVVCVSVGSVDVLVLISSIAFSSFSAASVSWMLPWISSPCDVVKFRLWAQVVSWIQADSLPSLRCS